MKKAKWILVLAVAMTVVFAAGAMADLTDITIYDHRSTTTGWYGQQEDQEVEPGMIANQNWDLEGVLWDPVAKQLSIVSGFNLNQGYDGQYSGDIFIDVTGDAIYGVDGGSGLYGYDYVIDVAWSNGFPGPSGTFEVYALAGATLTSANQTQNQTESNPVSVIRPESPTVLASGFVSLASSPTNYTAGGTTFTGGTHYIASFALSDPDLAFLDYGFLSHFTITCGNDNLIGEYNPVPEPATLLLLGSGLLGLAGAGRKKLIRK